MSDSDLHILPFHPSTTTEALKANVEFLRKLNEVYIYQEVNTITYTCLLLESHLSREDFRKRLWVMQFVLVWIVAYSDYQIRSPPREWVDRITPLMTTILAGDLPFPTAFDRLLRETPVSQENARSEG